MTDTPQVLSLASAAALLLALSQPGLASPETAAVGAPIPPPAAQVGPAPSAMPTAPAQPPVAQPPAPTAEAAPPAPETAAPGPEPAAAEAPAAEPPAAAEAPPPEPPAAEAAPAQTEAPRADLDAERSKRYQELRQRAAEVGLELPETPPWEAMPQMPEMPSMPGQGGVGGPDWEAMRAEREAMRERFKAMTPEERKAMRDAHWQKMRERAAERGMEMPETPPWEEAEKRYKAAQEQFDRYRKIVDEMSEEQLEAARALFGRSESVTMPRQPMTPQMPPQMTPQMPQGGYGYGPQGGYPGYGPYQGGPGAMGRHPMPYHEGGMEQAPPPPRGALPY